MGPRSSTHKALARAGLKIGDIDLFEINEAFGAQVLACNTDLKIDEERLNVNGGARSCPRTSAGCSGARLVVTLTHEMRRRGVALGVATMCIGIGQGIATVIEQVWRTAGNCYCARGRHSDRAGVDRWRLF